MRLLKTKGKGLVRCRPRLQQTDHGAHFADTTTTTVGGRPATIVTATVDDSLDGSLGCPSQRLGTFVRTRGGLLDSFLNADRIFDFLLSIGMKPFIELSFMPEALASGPTTVFKYRGNVTPPSDHRQWAAFIKRLVAHWVDRYGIREVADWFFEVWNEPNLKAFWTGSRKDYFHLYRTTVGAIKEVDPALRVGGPATARDGWIDEFIDFCETTDVAIDFISSI